LAQTELFKVGHDNWVWALAFHPSGKYLLSAADDGTICIWDPKTSWCMKKVQAHSPFVQCLAWGHVTADGQGDADRTVNVVATGGTDMVRSPSLAVLICTYQIFRLSRFGILDMNM
jgi:WD40 repeat protein